MPLNFTKRIVDKITGFLKKYPFPVHIFLVLWNTFVTSWATGIAVPLNFSDMGIPYSIDFNARGAVRLIQAHLHISTKVVGFLTLAVNATIAYTAWKRKHIHVIDVPEGSVVIAQAPVNKTLDTLEVVDDTVLKAKVD